MTDVERATLFEDLRPFAMRLIWKWAYRRNLGAHAADCVQEALLRLWLELPRFNPRRVRKNRGDLKAALRSWLYRRLIGAAQDYLRSLDTARRCLRPDAPYVRDFSQLEAATKKRESDRGHRCRFADLIVSRDPGPAQLAERRDLALRVISLLGRGVRRDVVLAHLLRETPMWEIARRMRVSESRVCQIYQGAVREVRARFRLFDAAPHSPIHNHCRPRARTERPSQREVGARAGVSHSYAGQILNGTAPDRVAPATRAAVLRAAADLGYVARATAGSSSSAARRRKSA